MYSFAICDDDPIFSADFEKKLAEVMSGAAARYELTVFHRPDELLNAMDGGRRFDLIFLDIMLDDKNGIDVAKVIREKRYDGDIIFITSYREYAFESYDVRPLHYLEKTAGLDKLGEAVGRFLEKSSSSMIYLANSRGALALDLSEIMYFEVLGHELVIHRSNGTKIRYRRSLRDMEELLPEDTFVRTQRSYMVNLAHVKEITRHAVTMNNGAEVPIGRGMYDNLRLKFLDYMAKKNAF